MNNQKYQKLVKTYVSKEEINYFLNSKEGRYQNRFYIDFFKKISKKSKILNIGCGTGTDSFCLFNRGFKNIIGVDINENYLKIAKKRCPSGIFIKANAYNLPFLDESFDVITIIATNEFLNAEKAFKEASRILKKNGNIYFENFNKFINSDLKKIHFLKKKIKTNKEYYTYYYWNLKKIVEKNGIKILKTGIFVGDPINKKKLLNRIFYKIISKLFLYKLFSPAHYFYAKKIN